MTTRVLIYGGTHLPQPWVAFAERMTRKLASYPDVVFISGGFETFKQHPSGISVDVAVADAAEAVLPPSLFARRFETWLPAAGLDRHTVRRFARGRRVDVPGSAQARRFALVETADAIVTIQGEGNTRTILELALAVNKPVLPVPASGGDSGRIWRRYQKEIIDTMRLPQGLVARLERSSGSAQFWSRLAVSVGAQVYEVAQKTCLVLMPYGRGHDTFYNRYLKSSIVDAGYVPHRIDQDSYAGNIPQLFREVLSRATAVVIDVTGENPNVMYEVGQVHARGISPFLVARWRGNAEAPRAFYLRHEKLTDAPDTAQGRRALARQVTGYLERKTRHDKKRSVVANRS